MGQPTLQIAFGNPGNGLKTKQAVISCYLTTDHIRFLAIKDIQRAFGYEGKADYWLLELLTGISRFLPIPTELMSALEYPIALTYHSADGTIVKIKALRADLLLPAVEIVVKAKNDGYLNLGRLRYAKAAQFIFEQYKNVDLQLYVDEVVGFNFFKTQAKERIKYFITQKVKDPAIDWILFFPDDFFETWFAVYELSWSQLYENSAKAAPIFYDLVFGRLPETVLDDLRLTKPKRAYKSKNTRDLLHPELKAYAIVLSQLLQTAGNNGHIFTQLLNRAYPLANPLKWYDSTTNQVQPAQLSGFNLSLKKGIERQQTYTQKKKRV